MDSSHHILHINPSLQVHIPLHVDLGFALGFCWEHLDILTLDMACYQLAQPTPAVPTSSLVEKTFESQSRKTTKSQKVPENAVEFSECYKKNKEKRNEDHSHVSHVCIIYILVHMLIHGLNWVLFLTRPQPFLHAKLPQHLRRDLQSTSELVRFSIGIWELSVPLCPKSWIYCTFDVERFFNFQKTGEKDVRWTFWR